MRDTDDSCSFRQGNWAGVLEALLPVEIPLAFEYSLNFAGGKDQPQFIVLAAQVHMGLYVNQARIIGRDSHFLYDLSVRITRRNHKVARGWVERDIARHRRAL